MVKMQNNIKNIKCNLSEQEIKKICIEKKQYIAIESDDKTHDKKIIIFSTNNNNNNSNK